MDTGANDGVNMTRYILKKNNYMIRIKFVFLFFMLSWFSSRGQSFCSVKPDFRYFESSILGQDNRAPGQSVKFIINGIGFTGYSVDSLLNVSYDTSLHKIGINNSGMDTVVVVTTDVFLHPKYRKHPFVFDSIRDKIRISIDTFCFLTKLLNDEKYLIRFNECTGFTFLPELHKKEYLVGISRCKVSSIEANTEYIFDGSDKRLFIRDTLFSDYIQHKLPLWCSGSPVKLAIYTENGASSGSEIYFLFLHREKLDLYYNTQNKKIEAKINGYN